MHITQVLVSGLLATTLPVQVAIAEAALQANHDARIPFQYDWLRQYLNRIRQGKQLNGETNHIDARACRVFKTSQGLV